MNATQAAFLVVMSLVQAILLLLILIKIPKR